EDTTLPRLVRPEQRPVVAVLYAAAQNVDLLDVADEIPVRLVDELHLVEPACDGMLRVGEADVKRAVTEARDAAAPRQADPLRQGVAVLVAVDGVVQVDQSAAALQEAVKLSALLRAPARVVRVEDDHVGRLKLLRRRP